MGRERDTLFIIMYGNFEETCDEQLSNVSTNDWWKPLVNIVTYFYP